VADAVSAAPPAAVRSAMIAARFVMIAVRSAMLAVCPRLGWIYPRMEAAPKATPARPEAAPRRVLDWEARPPISPMHRRPERVAAAASIAGNFPDMTPAPYRVIATALGMP